MLIWLQSVLNFGHYISKNSSMKNYLSYSDQINRSLMNRKFNEKIYLGFTIFKHSLLFQNASAIFISIFFLFFNLGKEQCTQKLIINIQYFSYLNCFIPGLIIVCYFAEFSWFFDRQVYTSPVYEIQKSDCYFNVQFNRNVITKKRGNTFPYQKCKSEKKTSVGKQQIKVLIN